jgi:hypothetical protein
MRHIATLGAAGHRLNAGRLRLKFNVGKRQGGSADTATPINTAITMLFTRLVHGHAQNQMAGGLAGAIGKQLKQLAADTGLLGPNSLCTTVHATHAVRVRRGGRMNTLKVCK